MFFIEKINDWQLIKQMQVSACDVTPISSPARSPLCMPWLHKQHVCPWKQHISQWRSLEAQCPNDNEVSGSKPRKDQALGLWLDFHMISVMIPLNKFGSSPLYRSLCK